MSRQASGTSKFTNPGPPTKSPQSSITETQDKIWIASKDLLGKAIQLWFELPSDVLGWEEGRVAGDSIRLSSAEPFEAIRGRMDIEDIGPIDFWMKGPNG